ncbi:protein dmr6-like oxygenase 2, partial [Quercus suber]
ASRGEGIVSNNRSYQACKTFQLFPKETFTHPWHPTEYFTHFLPKILLCIAFAEYAREIGGLMDRLLSLMSQGLGLEKDCLKRKIDGKWVPVEPVPDAFVVNMADQMEIVSYKSVVHKAVTNKRLPRLSLPMFYAPNNDPVIGPIEDLINKGHPPMHRNYSYKEYMDEFYRQEGARRVKGALSCSIRNVVLNS